MSRNNSRSNQVSAAPLIAGAVVLAFIVGIYNSIIQIEPGEVGIVILLGEAQENALNEGLHFVIPFITKVERLNVRILKAEVKTEAASKDLQVVKADIVVNYRVDKTQAVTLYRTIGQRYLETVIEPSIQEAFKAGSAKYTAEALITERATVSMEIRESINTRLEQRGVLIEAVNITSFDFSREFNRAIEDKVKEEQAAQKAENELKRIKVEAEQAEAKAKGEAAAILEKAQAEAEALSLKKEHATMELIWLTAVEKWDGKLPTHLFGTPPMPVFEAGGKE
jgi:regulator of protease activity HflC (stomatin/prohibitin superfamily)